MTSLKSKKKLVFLVHEGSAQSNIQAVEKAIKENKINAEITEIFSDKDPLPDLRNKEIDYICLAGWKRIIPEELISTYKIINMHPGLIPDTAGGNVSNPDGTVALWNKGKYADKAIQNFLDQNATYAGSTAHFLTQEFDFGPVLGRTFEKIEKGDDVGSLYARLKKKENELYVEILAKLCQTE